MDWLELAPTGEPGDETEVPRCHCLLLLTRLPWGLALENTSRPFLPALLRARRGSMFWMMPSEATAGAVGVSTGGLGLASRGTEAPGRSSWGGCPGGQSEWGMGKGSGNRSPHTPWPSVSVEADVGGTARPFRQSPEALDAEARSSLLPSLPGSFPTEAACDQRTSRCGIP